tara:strand:- start:56280 stop:57554 length:1275 start_codon:yes stop_codon:yes gene_type:complete
MINAVIQARVIIAMLIIATFSQQVISNQVKQKNIRLLQGDVRVLEVPGVERIAVGNSKIVSYKTLENGQLILVGETIGQTSIHIWQEHNRQTEYLITVLSTEVDAQVSLAKKLSSSIEGLSVNKVQSKIVFSGDVSIKDVPKLEQIKAILPDSIMLVEVQEFDLKKMVRMDVRVVEVNRLATNQLGINWATSANGPSVGISKTFARGKFLPSDTSPTDLSFFGFASLKTSLTSTIDLLAATGDAKILAAPKLLARSGERASFHSGGEFPYQVVGRDGVEVAFKEYGIMLEIEPFVDKLNNIKSMVRAEVSTIDQAQQLRDVPSLLTRNVESVVNAKNEETFVISGLTSARKSTNVNKVPFLGDIPYLGVFFKSTEVVIDETEIVIFVTPRIVAPNDTNDTDILNFAKNIQDEFRDGQLNKALME